jgi:lysozyme family protein
MKNNFDRCLEMLLHHEGGFVDHPKDPGGMTNLGVTRATLEQYRGRHVTEEEMRSLTLVDVASLYKTEYWDKVRGDDLPSGVDWAAFDWAVNSGSKRPAKAIQRIVGAKQDGAIGPKTLKSVSDIEPRAIVEGMYELRQKFYERLKTFETFGRGWSRRNKETLNQAVELIDA